MPEIPDGKRTMKIMRGEQEEEIIIYHTEGKDWTTGRQSSIYMNCTPGTAWLYIKRGVAAKRLTRRKIIGPGLWIPLPELDALAEEIHGTKPTGDEPPGQPKTGEHAP